MRSKNKFLAAIILIYDQFISLAWRAQLFLMCQSIAMQLTNYHCLTELALKTNKHIPQPGTRLTPIKNY